MEKINLENYTKIIEGVFIKNEENSKEIKIRFDSIFFLVDDNGEAYDICEITNFKKISECVFEKEKVFPTDDIVFWIKNEDEDNYYLYNLARNRCVSLCGLL